MENLIDRPVLEQDSATLAINRRQADVILRKGLITLNITLQESAIDRCLDHAEMLLRWNRVHNLSAIRNLGDVVVRHLLDSFSIVEHVKGKEVIDIGSGAGYPGIPIALARPDSHVVLLDSSMKKSEFLRHCVAQMGLCNVTVLCERVQELSKDCRSFDTVLVRALGSLATVAECELPILTSNGRILAMKGKYPKRELETIRSICDCAVHQLSVPGLSESRHLVVIKRKTN
ncbi:MAG: 16S rRNA (guanine(527)-N(7))-methyltransferase RsmG [Acidiferrobacterales bacterium]|nr:16S rRNA (guanine(527)-N(7))-methyltransferase RsmG [Acidiferrobacterales bacterium]